MGEPHAVSKFKYRLSRGFNAVPPQPVFAALVFFGLHDWPRNMLEGKLQGSLASLHPAVQLWHMSVAFLATFSLVFFAWKCLVLWLAMRRLGHASAGLKLTVRESHHDGCGGLSPITSCWLHVHDMIVIVGVYVFGYAILLNQWTNPTFLLAAVMYAILAPAVLVGPFVAIHNGMAKYREEELTATAGIRERAEEAVRGKMVSPQSIGDDLLTLCVVADFHRKRNEAARRIPTWPFNVRVWQSFLVSYLVPFAILGFRLAWPAP